TVKDYSIRYEDAQAPVFENLEFAIKQGDRLFLNGKNGCGKSSIIKAILTRISEKEGAQNSIIETGTLTIAPNLEISYINQDTSFLQGNIKDFCKEKGLDESLFCAILRQLDMERVQFAKNMEDFSEGQKKKVLIAASLMTPAHLYIWDEPLNYIDVFSRMQIEQLILTYNPTMLIVEHDVRFRETIATETVEFG
ncbi:MAG: ABC-F family ATP-binding cassette domain-containing protein, partial [Lachnospiraceae bacterium]|nr:ABC-F family ATP-binding cassette domain-containing protein [Lachnospiraceae bacterium]